MSTVRSAFGMTAIDATSISRALSNANKYCPNLTSLTLKGNRIDDELVRILMDGLLRNDTVTALDMSHNRITSIGARMISKLLGQDSVLTALNLSDNQIREEGGRYIGRGLRKNDSLLELNLRLNLLKDGKDDSFIHYKLYSLLISSWLYMYFV
jgi:Ran GTPase-activating protein (RanGAP) involved in mRNA processing and transport